MLRLFPPLRIHALLLAACAAAAIVASCASAQSAPPRGQPTDVASDAAGGGQLARGEDLYRANCQTCHGDARTGEGGLPGAPVHGSTGHTWHHSDQNLTEIILDGSGEMGAMMRDMMGIPPETPRMPAWRGKLTDDDIAAILAYIKAGWTLEQRRFQAETPMMRYRAVFKCS